MRILLLAALLAFALACGTSSSTAPYPPGGAVPTSCAVFPQSNWWNQDISGFPVDTAHSAAWVASIGAGTPPHPDFGSVYGIPYALVGASTQRMPVAFDYDDESDAGPYPIPPNPPIEDGSDGHMLLVDVDACKLYELFDARPGAGKWLAGSGAIFDLTSNLLRPDGWTSADAAGLPIFAGLVRYEEAVEQGEIRHALRFTANTTQRAYVHPATHFASDDTNPNLPLMGARARLKASVDISSYPAEVKAVLQALKTYGMFLADNGSDWYITGAPDPRWDDDRLHTLQTGGIKGSDFEFVDTGEAIHTN